MRIIGGDFEINDCLLFSQDLAINACLERHKKSNYILINNGRSAIYLAIICALNNKVNKIAYLPYYCCESIIIPFQQLGFTIHYYSMGKDLCSPEGLPDNLQSGIFFFIHFFGKKNTLIIDYINFQRSKSNTFLVIEDCVQTCLSSVGGDTGDFCIHSLRKFSAVPDLGMLTFKNDCHYSLLEPAENYVSMRFLAKRMRAANQQDVALQLYKQSELMVEKECLPRKASWLSSYLSARIDYDAIQKKRSDNWLYLEKLLAGVLGGSIVTILYKNIDPDEVPLIFPLMIHDGKRDDIKQYLASKNIYAPVHWPLNIQTPSCALFEADIAISEKILGLPIDQRLLKTDIERMVETINSYIKLVRI